MQQESFVGVSMGMMLHADNELMKWWHWIVGGLLIFSLTTSCLDEAEIGPDGQNPGWPSETSFLFDKQSVPEIVIEVSVEEWNKLLSYFDQNPDNEHCVVSRFVMRKDHKEYVVDSVGLRLRGNTSRRRPEGSTGGVHQAVGADWNHASFGVKFSEYKKKQEFAGTDRVNLKWFKDDAAYVREIYCYDLFERFGVWTAPRSSYCRLTISVSGDPKPAYFGVYQLLEAVNKQFVKDRTGNKQFISKEGYVWKCSYGADLKNGAGFANLMGVEEVNLNAALSKNYVYDLKTNEKELELAKAQFVGFINQLNALNGTAFRQWIATTMDVDLFLKTYAVNVMVGMWDDYWNNKNNYYFYFDANQKAYFIPYDYDNTLGTSLLMENSGTRNLLQWGSSPNRPLILKILEIPEYKARYQEYIRMLAHADNDLFDPQKSMTRIRNWQNQIAPYVFNDTGEDLYLIDQPASWGNCSFYRLRSGNALGGAQGDANFFSSKVQSISF